MSTHSNTHLANQIQGAATLALLRSKSQNNNRAQSVIGTYLTATGAQRQHCSVFSALGIGTSYNSIVQRPTMKSAGKNESAKSKQKKKPSPGTLYLLSQACRQSARKVASSHLFITVYDNINMMIKVAEQVLGRKSMFNHSIPQNGVDTPFRQTLRRMGLAPL